MGKRKGWDNAVQSIAQRIVSGQYDEVDAIADIIRAFVEEGKEKLRADYGLPDSAQVVCTLVTPSTVADMREAYTRIVLAGNLCRIDRVDLPADVPAKIFTLAACGDEETILAIVWDMGFISMSEAIKRERAS